MQVQLEIETLQTGIGQFVTEQNPADTALNPNLKPQKGFFLVLRV